MRQLGWTSKRQSKKLVDAGLKTDTADMFYLYDWNNHKHNNTPDTLVIYNWEDHYNKSIPCWSLGALIDLLPKTIETKKPKNLYFPEILPASNCVAYIARNENKEYVFLKSIADSTLLDSVVEMIVWLLNNNYIKKGNRL